MGLDLPPTLKTLLYPPAPSPLLNALRWNVGRESTGTANAVAYFVRLPNIYIPKPDDGIYSGEDSVLLES